MKEFKGVYCVIPTPFNQDGEFDGKAKEVLRRVIDFVIERGAHGIIPAAGSGEFFLLSELERKEIIDITIDQVNGRIPVVAGTGATRTGEVIMYSKYAEKAGADGVMVITPYYSLPTDEEIYAFYEEVASAIDIPIMVYNDPFPTGVDIRPKSVARLAEIDNINSIKESSMDLKRIQEIMRLCGDKIVYFFGNDYPALDAFLLGAQGWVASAYFVSIGVKLYTSIIEEKNVEKAKEIYSKLLEVVEPTSEGELSNPSSYIAIQKVAFELMGISVGPPRDPLSSLTDKAKKILREKMMKAGILPRQK